MKSVGITGVIPVNAKRNTRWIIFYPIAVRDSSLETTNANLAANMAKELADGLSSSPQGTSRTEGKKRKPLRIISKGGAQKP